ncbi:MAG: thiamine-phosphate kinase [Pseudomonadota bacterium]
MPTEFELIRSLQKIFGVPRAPLVGIGDDAAVFRAPAGWDLVWTVDTHVEGVHFRWEWLKFEELGGRAAACALSDIAAMGARPMHGLVSFEFPRDHPARNILGIARGIRREFQRCGASILGGNISSAAKFSVQITVIGRVQRGKAWLRSTARPGDDVYVTGSPGLSALALEILSREKGRKARFRPVLSRWRSPTARVREALRLNGLVSAAIDVSDGLLADARHMADASRVDLHLDLSAIPVPVKTRRALKELGLDWTSLLARPSDDYELLFTAKPRNRASIEQRLRGGVHRIGSVRRGIGRIWSCTPGATKVLLHPTGWDHLS